MVKFKKIKKKGYDLYFVHPDDEKTLTDLRNTGRVIGEINVTSNTPGDNFDEVIVAVRTN